jgi:hypothetical protein
MTETSPVGFTMICGATTFVVGLSGDCWARRLECSFIDVKVAITAIPTTKDTSRIPLE